MCVVSMVGDHYADKWPKAFPNVFPKWPMDPPHLPENISRDEFEELKRDVLEMKELLKRAKSYDERNNEPDCEVDEKMALLRKVAEAVGVNIDDLLGKKRA